MAATTNAALKKRLLEKLGITPQALSLRAQKRKKEVPMSTPHAVYTIAHEEGIDISKYLSDEETATVRGLVAELNKSSSAPAPSRPARKKAASSKPATVKVTIAGVDAGKIPALSRAHANDVKRMSERVYPLLYIFENSVRDLIERVLENAYGPEWWTTAVPKAVRDTATKHKAAEAKEPWHGARGKREIDDVFLNELWAIIKHK